MRSTIPLAIRWQQAKRVLVVLALALLALLAVLMAFISPSLTPGDMHGAESIDVPVDADGYVRCGGSSLAIAQRGARVPDVGTGTQVVRNACEEEAATNVGVAAAFAIIVLGGVAWLTWRRWQRGYS
jgi:hypothetical protein